ncbi:hypothetical protein DL98DRAFT_431889, partial [Cadophora sp. DSE1049]
LKLSYKFIRLYLYKLNRTDSDLYKYNKKKTTAYLLLNCKKTRIAKTRAKLRDKIKKARLSLLFLIYTKIRIEKTLDFLKKTRLCTKKWFLKKRQEKKQEE